MQNHKDRPARSSVKILKAAVALAAVDTARLTGACVLLVRRTIANLPIALVIVAVAVFYDKSNTVMLIHKSFGTMTIADVLPPPVLIPWFAQSVGFLAVAIALVLYALEGLGRVLTTDLGGLRGRLDEKLTEAATATLREAPRSE